MKIPSGWIFKTSVDRKGLKVFVEANELILCKDCKYYETDHFEKVNGMPLIVGQVCTKWAEAVRQVKTVIVIWRSWQKERNKHLLWTRKSMKR